MEGFRYTSLIPVRFRDLDGMGHVNNAVYLTYFEAARIPYYLLLRGEPEVRRADMIVGEITCTYRSPATFGETLVVGVRVREIRTHSFSLDYRIEDQATGRLVATGVSIQVAYDYAAKQTKPVPTQFVQAAESYEARALQAAPAPGRAERAPFEPGST